MLLLKRRINFDRLGRNDINISILATATVLLFMLFYW